MSAAMSLAKPNAGHTLNPSAKEYKPSSKHYLADSQSKQQSVLSAAMSPIAGNVFGKPRSIQQPSGALSDLPNNPTCFFGTTSAPPPIVVPLPLYLQPIHPFGCVPHHHPSSTDQSFPPATLQYIAPTTQKSTEPAVGGSALYSAIVHHLTATDDGMTAAAAAPPPPLPPVSPGTPDLQDVKPVCKGGAAVVLEGEIHKNPNRKYPTPPRVSRNQLDSRRPNRKGRGGGRVIIEARYTTKLGSSVARDDEPCRFEWREKTNHCPPIRGSTTVMIRNIPNKLSREALIMLVGEHCKTENEKAAMAVDDSSAGCFRRSEFDFLYLPFCFRRLGNKGYAFVNFTAVDAAFRFQKSWNGFDWSKYGFSSKKVVVITRAMIQGKDELKKHFRKTVFCCQNDEFLPIELTPPADGTCCFELIRIGTRCDPGTAQ